MNFNTIYRSFLIIGIAAIFTVSAQAESDAAIQTANDSIQLALTNRKLDSLANQLDSLKKNLIFCQKTECTGEVTGFWEWLVVLFMPGTMLLLAFIFMIKFWNSKDFTASRLLGITPDEGENNKLQSTSRFILILTGLTAIFASTTLVMYYGYMMVAQCNNAMNLDGLWKILAGLGIGIIPYGINVWNKNTKEEAATQKPNS